MNRFYIATGRNPEPTWSLMEMTPITKGKMERKWMGLSGLCFKCLLKLMDLCIAGKVSRVIVDPIENSDIVITINSKGGKLISPQMRVYAKDGDELRQIGLIQNISVNASVEKLDAEMCIGFPLEKEEMSDNVKGSLKKYSALLAEKGCGINPVACN